MPIPISPFEKRPMVERALFIINQLGLVSVNKGMESDKKNVLHWVLRDVVYH